MKIALISDTHNEQGYLRRVVERLRAEGITTVLHAGDVTSTGMLHILKEFDLWIAQGNMDPPLLRAAVQELFGPDRLRPTHDLHLDGVRIALTHSHHWEEWRDLIASGEYDYVVYGHTHALKDERVGSTRVLNPGALHKPRGGQESFAILHTATDDVEIVFL